jgi:hypothetical protein
MEDREIDFGGQRRKIRLTSGDAKSLKKRFDFGNGVAEWLSKDVLGMRLDLASNSAGDIEAQHVTLAAALSRAYPKHPITEVQVERWWDDLLEAIREGRADKDACKQILWDMFATAHAAGWPTGRPRDVEDEDHAGLKKLFFAQTVEDMLLEVEQMKTADATTTETTPTPSQHGAVRAADNP